MYYRLTYISSSNKERLGDFVQNGNKPLHIGQGVSCNVQLPESDMYEPQVYATILQKEDGDCWYLVKRTDCHQVLVNGAEVSLAQILQSGDKFSFSDGTTHTELLFETFDDGEYDANSGIVYKKHKSNKRSYVAAIVLGLLALGVAAYGVLSPRQLDLRHSDLNQHSQSVYHIVVDSIYLLCDGIVVDSIELAEVAAGTAFLALDGVDTLFVTARHCIEPWINDEEWDGVSSKAKMSPEVRLATKAETENRLAGYDKYVLRSHCVISKGFERYDYYSTDFYMNKSRDMVMRLGTTKEAIYWRTIFPIAHRRDMELGDFAYIKAERMIREGNGPLLSLAEWDEIRDFTKSKNHDIAVIGYPLNDNDADDASFIYGNHTGFALNDSIKSPVGCLQMSAPINRGNSGGPIVAMIGTGIKVIGIVSKADGRANQGIFWAVPVTEVIDMHRHGDEVEQDSVIYRR